MALNVRPEVSKCLVALCPLELRVSPVAVNVADSFAAYTCEINKKDCLLECDAV